MSPRTLKDLKLQFCKTKIIKYTLVSITKWEKGTVYAVGEGEATWYYVNCLLVLTGMRGEASVADVEIVGSRWRSGSQKK